MKYILAQMEFSILMGKIAILSLPKCTSSSLIRLEQGRRQVTSVEADIISFQIDNLSIKSSN